MPGRERWLRGGQPRGLLPQGPATPGAGQSKGWLVEAHRKVGRLVSSLPFLLRAPPSFSGLYPHEHVQTAHNLWVPSAHCVSSSKGMGTGEGTPGFSQAGQLAVRDASWPALPSHPALEAEDQHTAPASAL